MARVYYYKVEGEALVLRRFFDNEAPTGDEWTQVSKTKYDEISSGMLNHPLGEFDGTSWIPETKQKKDKREKDLEDKEKEKDKNFKDKEDVAWLERYHRFKANGDIE